MATTIKIKSSSVEGEKPSPEDLVEGELAVNLFDGILYTKSGGAIIPVGGDTAGFAKLDEANTFTEANDFNNATLTKQSVPIATTDQLPDLSDVAYLANDQTFEGINNFVQRPTGQPFTWPDQVNTWGEEQNFNAGIEVNYVSDDGGDDPTQSSNRVEFAADHVKGVKILQGSNPSGLEGEGIFKVEASKITLNTNVNDETIIDEQVAVLSDLPVVPGFSGVSYKGCSAVVDNGPSTPGLVTFTTPIYDIGNWSTDGSNFVVPDGVTHISVEAMLDWELSYGGIIIYKNGGMISAITGKSSDDVSGEKGAKGISWAGDVAPTDTITIQAFVFPAGGTGSLINAVAFVSINAIGQTFTVKTDPAFAPFTADNTWSGRNDFNGGLYINGEVPLTEETSFDGLTLRGLNAVSDVTYGAGSSAPISFHSLDCGNFSRWCPSSDSRTIVVPAGVTKVQCVGALGFICQNTTNASSVGISIRATPPGGPGVVVAAPNAWFYGPTGTGGTNLIATTPPIQVEAGETITCDIQVGTQGNWSIAPGNTTSFGVYALR